MDKLRVVGMALVALLTCMCSVQAQEYPAPGRAIMIVVPVAAGGPTDLPVRLFAERAKKDINANMVVENKPGAGTIIGVEYVTRAQPDGYTLLFGGGSVWQLPMMFKDLRFDPTKDLAPISTVMEFLQFLLINSQTPAKNIDEFIAYAKANPGKLNYGAVQHHVTMLQIEAFKRVAGIKLQEISYSGQATYVQALLRNDVQLVTGSPGGIKGMIDDGRLRPVLYFGAARSQMYPDVPSVGEKGWNLPGAGWYALFAPAATPKPILDKLSAEMRRFTSDPEAQKMVMDRAGARLIGSTPEELRQQFDADLKVWKDVADSVGMKPE
jgi:tripartite-type tricarboxylate transporter receptor subunit TctC